MKKYKITLFIIVPVFILIFLFLLFKTSNEKFENLVAVTQIQNKKSSTDAPAPDSGASVSYLMGKFDPAKMENFVPISSRYYMPGYAGLYLRKEAYDAFVKMSDTAKKDGVLLKIISATRNFDTQKDIWNTKWNKYHDVKEILKYSAMPGTSRHHWGTDLDINSIDPAYFDTENGKKEYDWLSENAKSFGFCQPYSEKVELGKAGRTTGYNEEKWHWSYTPLSKGFINDFKNKVKISDLIGFSGVEKISEVNVIDDYVLGINPECLED